MLNIFGLEISTKKLIGSVIYLVAVFVVYMILKRVVTLMLERAGGKKANSAQRQHLRTISQMIESLLKYGLIILAVLVLLANLGVNVGSLLAGLGIMTAVVGLALQDMIKDIIAGIAILAENQFSVGDIVEIDGFKGKVLSVGFKTTEIEDEKGAVKIIANHSIDGLINYSKFKGQR